MGRAPCCEKVGLNRGKWTAEEDEILTNYILAHGEGSWRSLPKKAGLLRCGKSCRLRWVNYLKSGLKRGSITAEEEEAIVKLRNSLGNRWSSIATHLPGRTHNETKNHWDTHLRRKIYCFSHLGKESLLTTANVASNVNTANTGNNIRKSGRQAAMKKNKNIVYPTTKRAIESNVNLDQLSSATPLYGHHVDNIVADQAWPTSSKEKGSERNSGEIKNKEKEVVMDNLEVEEWLNRGITGLSNILEDLNGT